MVHKFEYADNDEYGSKRDKSRGSKLGSLSPCSHSSSFKNKSQSKNKSKSRRRWVKCFWYFFFLKISMLIHEDYRILFSHKLKKSQLTNLFCIITLPFQLWHTIQLFHRLSSFRILLTCTTSSDRRRHTQLPFHQEGPELGQKFRASSIPRTSKIPSCRLW